MKVILDTGTAGFIGYKLLGAILRKGKPIIDMDIINVYL